MLSCPCRVRSAGSKPVSQLHADEGLQLSGSNLFQGPWHSYTEGGITTELVGYTKQWMQHLPNNTPLWKVSIPGTHDSGTAGVNALLDSMAKCQVWTIPHQLEAGIRFFDIRVRVAKSGNIGLWHSNWYCNTNLNEVLTQVTNFLKANPKEFVILKLQWEDRISQLDKPKEFFKSLKNLVGIKTTDEDMSVAEGLPHVLNTLKRFAVLTGWSPTTSVNDCRGKILLMTKGNDISSLTNGGFARAMKSEFTADAWDEDVTVRKIGSVENLLVGKKDSRELLTGWWNVAKGTKTPADYAKRLNVEALQLFGRLRSQGVSTLGAQVFDFPGNGLIMMVINYNLLNWNAPRIYTTQGNTNSNTFELNHHRPYCPQNEAMTEFKLFSYGNDLMAYHYTCTPKSLSDCSDHTTPLNDAGNGNVVYLDRHSVRCGDGKVLTGFELNRDGGKVQYKARCCRPQGGTRTSVELTTGMNVGDSRPKYLDRHDVACKNGQALTEFKLERDGRKDNYQYRYKCAALN